MNWDCSCWAHYPNKSHKHKNGHWKCVDDYICIRDLIDGRYYDACTHCIRKENSERYMMGAKYRGLLENMENGVICKAVVGDYIIYKKSWLQEHLDQEVTLLKAYKDFCECVDMEKFKAENKNLLEQLRKQLKGET